jgi:hypothetical protein
MILTKRYVDELAMTWWRRDQHPIRTHGSLETFADLDTKMMAYCQGASLDIENAYRILLENANTNSDADDFPSEVATGFLLALDSHVPDTRQKWIDKTSGQECFAQQRSCVTQWLAAPIECVRKEGLDLTFSKYGFGNYDEEVSSSQPEDELRFIDGLGRIRGYFSKKAASAQKPTCLPTDFGGYCSEVLAGMFDPTTLVKQVITVIDEPSDALMVLGIAGSTFTLPWLLENTKNPAMTALAYDAIYKITGFDALEESGIDPKSQINNQTALMLFEMSNEWLSRNDDVRTAQMPLLLGKPASASRLWEIIRCDKQREREIAAMRLALVTKSQFVFPVRANAFAQYRALSIPRNFGVNDVENY